NAQRQDCQGVVDELGENPVVAHSIAPDTGVVRRQSFPALPRVFETFEVVQVREHAPLHGAIELLELAVELSGGLDAPPGYHLAISSSSATSGRLRRPPASKMSIASSAAKASSRS